MKCAVDIHAVAVIKVTKIERRRRRLWQRRQNWVCLEIPERDGHTQNVWMQEGDVLDLAVNFELQKSS